VLHPVPDLDAALAALVPSLAPGGLFISKMPCLRDLNPLITYLAVPMLRAVRLAPPLRRLDADALRAAFERQGLVVEAVERHGTRGRDFRPFLITRKPNRAGAVLTRAASRCGPAGAASGPGWHPGLPR
jgi:hypothetical protein